MLAKNVKELRKKMNWSQQKLADTAGIAYNAVTQIEQNRVKIPNIQTLEKIAEAFGVSSESLLQTED
jgi:transcriptional regulator with XRE-family HTH domain